MGLSYEETAGQIFYHHRLRIAFLIAAGGGYTRI